jgi:glycerol-3-phosphate acyltransferase PlsY
MALSQSSQTTAGWVVFIAGIGMMAAMMAVDIAQLMNWNEAMTPAFVGTCIGHFGAVITAFVGGKLIPEGRDPGTHTRQEDPKP